MSGQRWQICTPLSADSLAQRVSRHTSTLLVQLLHNRGVTDPSLFEPFLAADDRLSHDSSLLPDVDKAVNRILRALL